MRQPSAIATRMVFGRGSARGVGEPEVLLSGFEAERTGSSLTGGGVVVAVRALVLIVLVWEAVLVSVAVCEVVVTELVTRVEVAEEERNMSYDWLLSS